MRSPDTVEELTIYSRIEDLKPRYFSGLPRLRRLMIAPTLNEIHESGGVDMGRAIRTGTTLRAGLFEELGNLRELTIHRKRVERIEPGAFRGLLRLTSLNLSGNQLTDLERGALAGPVVLQHLSLEQNGLTEILPRYFEDSSTLWRLNLDGNRIRRLCPLAFLSLENLISLSIAHNRLRLIDRQALLGMKSLSALNLSGNPLLERCLAHLDVLEPRAMVSLSHRKATGSFPARELQARYAMVS